MNPDKEITRIPAPEYAPATRKTATTFARDNARDAAEKLVNSFTWSETAEGEAFWSAVANRLRGIARGEPLK